MTSTPQPAIRPELSRVELAVERLRSLLKQRRLADCAAEAARLAAELPENRDVLYVLAQAQRYQQQIDSALATLARLEAHHPRFSRLHQERGHCYVALRDAPRAIDAYTRALAINSALPATWSMLEGVYRLTGNTSAAAHAAAQAASLRALPEAVVTATGLFCEGEVSAAEKLVRAFLLEHGDHIEAMRLLARIGTSLQVYDDAELLLAAVLERAPDYVAARHDYACVLLERHKHREARAQLERLLALDPGNRVYRTLLATTTVGLGDSEGAVRQFRELLADAPPNSREAAELHLSVAHSLKTLGRRAESIEAYHAAAAARPDFGDAYWSVANLKTYRFTDEAIAHLEATEAAPQTATADRYNLCFALGKALEDRADYARSWAYYARGNALKRAESRYRPELLELNTSNQKQVCTRAFFEERAEWGLHSDAPIFIVGLPRSGSTLIEQILASHSCVEGTQELADIPRIVLDLQGRDPDLDNPRYPGVLAGLTREQIERLAQKYLDDTHVYRTGKPRFIDKMPNNFRHLGLIHLMFPNARIIDARREPMACCFGNLKQLYARGQEFAYSVEDIARYYRTYLELMAHWEAVLPPGRVLRVLHEEVVEDLEGSVRRILGFCGLEFEPACREFHKTERSVRTASSEQVRQPIFREGLDQWRNFEPWLEPLRGALADALIRYRD
jgi:tetratricopeptide (TPR) repeat protein